jgi:hypothetical protein
VVPEETKGCGAKLRDGTYDGQVDVFLRADSDDKNDDLMLQVFLLPADAWQLGRRDAAIEFVINEASIAEALTHKDDYDAKDTIDLVLSCPCPIGDPTRAALRAAAAAGRFHGRGYARVWLVDAAGWVAVLAGDGSNDAKESVPC